MDCSLCLPSSLESLGPKRRGRQQRVASEEEVCSLASDLMLTAAVPKTGGRL